MKKNKFITECPNCSHEYTAEDINGGRCTAPGCGTMITDPMSRSGRSIREAEQKRIHLADIKILQNENKRLTAWVADLQSGMTVNCVYCGHSYGYNTKTPVSKAQMLYDHIKVCKQHPLSKALKENKKLKALNRKMDGVLTVIYDVLYFDPDKECYDPKKEWDSACDFIEMVDAQIRTIIPEPQNGSTERPEFI
jgi:uncharacterized Zn-finger protein